MKPDLSKTCPQTRRALRLLLSPNAPKIDQQALIDALPGPTPITQKELIDLIIQIILALLENKDGDKEEKPNGPHDLYDELRRVAKEAAIKTITPNILKHDVPVLVASIRSIAAMIPVPGFHSHRDARESMRLANNSALDLSVPMWNDWNDAIREEMENLDEAGLLTELPEYKRAWLAIVEGLETIN